jgi:preprotein translocase subunit SecG
LREFFLTLLWVVFIVDSVLLVLIVLLQSGRGGGLSGMLGGGGMAESALGPKSGLPRITGAMAAIFFLSAILIGVMTRPRQAMRQKAPEEGKTPIEKADSGAPKSKVDKGPEADREGSRGAEEGPDEKGGAGPEAGPSPAGLPEKGGPPTTPKAAGKAP